LNNSNLKVENDGIDHINVYSKAKTKLGRRLSNFEHLPFECEDGRFNSIEGYWYYLGTDSPQREQLRTLSGYKAKELGRSLDKLKIEPAVFRKKIKAAITIKICSSDIWRDLAISELPLVHYYAYGTKPVFAPQHDWIIDHIIDLREWLKTVE